QLCSQNVHFLGNDITPEGKSLSTSRIQAIVDVPKPITKKQVLFFQGMTGYCRQWIPDYAAIARPLEKCAHGHNLSAHSPVSWTPEAENSFKQLKVALTSAPVLMLPDNSKPFFQAVDDKEGFMTSVLLQKHGDKLKPVTYFSCVLDPAAAGLPHSLKRHCGIFSTHPISSSCSNSPPRRK
ncbi:hypothetical protein LDENG_00007750, partial [Lucifuga dentata]